MFLPEMNGPHGLAFTNAVLAQVAGWIAARPADAPFAYAVTPNADHLVRLARDPALLPAYRGAALCLLDSRVVAGIGRAIGLPMPPVVPGSDLTAALLRAHLHPGERITIVGLAPSWLPALVAQCGLAPPAHHDPPMGFDRDPAALAAAVRFVLEHPARFVFLAVGSPRQERLAEAVAATGQATGFGLCIGASLEFLAGVRRRAPLWMQQAGLEWLHRLATDPRRLARRYGRDSPAVIGLLLRQRALMRQGAQPRSQVMNRASAP
jgi:exopolysaccharide biosynthesis WecB/TagA/CpsF family protein